MTRRKPCNHRNAYRMGTDELNASTPKEPRKVVKVEVRWCQVCGAITFAGGWMYPRRAWPRGKADHRG